jgi:fimbrial chaperone protein
MLRARLIITLLIGIALALGPTAAAASQLRLAPVTLSLTPSEPATTVRLWNDSRTPVHVQIRIFKETVVNGRKLLEPTRDLAVSPPMAVLSPGSENIVRVISTGARKGTYRLLIDELPNPRLKQGAGTVSLVMRHAIPVRVGL